MDYNDLERLSTVVSMALMKRMGTDSVTFTEQELENVQQKGIVAVDDMNCLLFDNESEKRKVTVKIMPYIEAVKLQVEKEKKLNEDSKRRR